MKTNEPILILPLRKGWSDEARAAAAAARKGQGSGPSKVSAPSTAAAQGDIHKAGGKSKAAKPDSRAAKAAAEQPQITVSDPTETSVHHTVEVVGRHTPPPVDKSISLSGDRKVLDYGHVNQLLKEKYGNERGDKSYHAMIDNPSASRGLHFVVGQNIQREKMTMMAALGKVGSPDNHHYQGLRALYREKTGI